MLPKRKFNIYPRNNENMQALISFYFDDFEIIQDRALDELNKHPSLTLNQIEFIFQKLIEAYEPIFEKN